MNRFPFSRRRRSRTAAVALLTVLLAAGCGSVGSGALTLTEQDGGGIVSVPSGEAVEILLTANPTTGHQWHWEIRGDAVRRESEEFLPPAAAPGNPVGVPGRTRLLLRAVRPGTAKVTARYHRPWETFQPDRDRQLAFTIEVKAAQPEKTD